MRLESYIGTRVRPALRDIGRLGSIARDHEPTFERTTRNIRDSGTSGMSRLASWTTTGFCKFIQDKQAMASLSPSGHFTDLDLSHP